MNISPFDQNRKNENSSYGESVRLSNELRSKPEIRITGVRNLVNVTPAKVGFNCETGTYNEFTKWLNDTTIKKSQSLFWFVIRIMAWRFPTKHTEIKNNLAERRKLEFDLILSQMKKEIEWIGQTGYQNMIVLESANKLNNSNVRIIKKKNDSFKFVRK